MNVVLAVLAVGAASLAYRLVPLLTGRQIPTALVRGASWAGLSVIAGITVRSALLLEDPGVPLAPVIAPLSWKHPDEAVRLGRATEWQELESGEQAPVGMKMLLLDGEEVPFLDMRQLEIQVSEAAAS